MQVDSRYLLITMVWNDDLLNQPVSALSDCSRIDGRELGVDKYVDCFIECDDGRGYHEIGYTDYLRFATERGDLDGEINANGWLTSSALLKYEARARDYLKDAGLPTAPLNTLSAGDQAGGDDPNVTFTITVPSNVDMTVGQMWDQIGWPFIATLINVTDPGTFNSPYLWA